MSALQMPIETDEEYQVPDIIVEWGRDMKAAARLLTHAEARFLVDYYYTVQGHRIRTQSQIRATMGVEPNAVIRYLQSETQLMEGRVKIALDAYTDASRVGRWCKSNQGIGPVISAGFLARLDITKAPTAGHFWRFAGLDPTLKWVGSTEAESIVKGAIGTVKKRAITETDITAVATAANTTYDRLRAAVDQNEAFMKKIPETHVPLEQMTSDMLVRGLSKRPWNASLRVLCWKLGESFVKVCNKDGALYGRVYKERKELETQRNEEGLFADQAEAVLLGKSFRRDTTARASYKAGKLPPAHIHARARRYAVKLFLAHLHHVMHFDRYHVDPPRPYVMDHMGHAHKIEAPNWPIE